MTTTRPHGKWPKKYEHFWKSPKKYEHWQLPFQLPLLVLYDPLGPCGRVRRIGRKWPLFWPCVTRGHIEFFWAKYEHWQLPFQLPLLVLFDIFSDVVACVAWPENDLFFGNALHAAIWTQGVIKYEQWKLKRKLPMLVLFRRWILWPRVRHVQDVLISKAKNAEKIASS